MTRGRRGNGEGTIYQRQDGRWSGQITTGRSLTTGKLSRWTVYGKTRTEVLDKLDEKRRDLKAGLIQDSDMPVGEFLDFWLERVQGQVAPATYLRYSLDVKNLKPYLQGIRLSKLRAVHVGQLYQQMSKDGYSADTVHKAAVRLRQVLGDACQLGLLRDNPSMRLRLPRVSHKEIYPLTAEQVRHFLEVNKESWYYPLYITAFDTGARQGELFALTRRDWTPERRELQINKSLYQGDGEYAVGPCKTRASRRTLRVGPRTAEALAGLLKRPEGNSPGLLFTSPEGGYIARSNFIRRHFRSDLKRAGIQGSFRFHDIRHTTATLLLQAGVDVRTVAAQLGHTDPVMVLRNYGHVLPAMRDRAATVMAGMLEERPVPEKQPGSDSGQSGSQSNAA